MFYMVLKSGYFIDSLIVHVTIRVNRYAPTLRRKKITQIPSQHVINFIHSIADAVSGWKNIASFMVASDLSNDA